jgi:2-succinyl-5-enolpyruvyl-6-hydroxy-3-cyclohexene-1-carboxylate synthase
MGIYTDERNAQIIIQLLKENNIRKVVASPGTTNACFVASLQGDSFFEIYSAPEERVGAYLACGLAAESGEAVVLSCTGATASRNYMPGLTEAYYRKLPILTITSSRRNAYIGHNMDQVTDRTVLPNDIANISVQMPIVHDEVSEWQCIIAANKAILELTHRGGGPAHINLETTYSRNSVSEIPPVRCIKRFGYGDQLPILHNEKIAIFVGNHHIWSEELTQAVDAFCASHDAVVLCDHTSNYKGKYRVFASLLSNQAHWKASFQNVDILIHIGDVSTSDFNIAALQVWRICPDGELKDTFRKLKFVFEFEEVDFFKSYIIKDSNNEDFYKKCIKESKELYDSIPELPFSNLWLAEVTAKRLPDNSVLHLGIRNSLRTWNFYDTPYTVKGFSNTGGFGIDGSISTVVGAALAYPQKLYYCVLGDLAFFYDINVFGNRHFPSNVRILVVNNGVGLEMRGSFTLGYKIARDLGVDEEKFIAAGGHYGQGKKEVIRHFVDDFGCEYISASNKAEYLNNLDHFLDGSYYQKSIVFEVFVSVTDEETAINLVGNLIGDKSKGAKTAVRKLIGESNYDSLKRNIKKVIK